MKRMCRKELKKIGRVSRGRARGERERERESESE